MSGGRIAWVDYANGEHWKRKECKISINKTRVKERGLGRSRRSSLVSRTVR